MSKLNLMKASVLASLLALAGLTAQAMPGGHHGGYGGHGMAGGPRIEHLLEQIDASDAQRSQVKQIMKSAADELRPQQQALRELRSKGQALLTAPTVDAAAIESLRQQSQAQQELISKRMSQALVAAANVLTPEQRAKLAERMAKRQARMAERMAEHKAEHRTERSKP